MSRSDDVMHTDNERLERARPPGTTAGGDAPQWGDGVAIGATDEPDTFEPEEPSE